MEGGDALRIALAATREELHARTNVVATGIGYKLRGGERTGELAIVCSVTEKVPLAELTPDEIVPSRVDGVLTDVIATGPFRALAVPTDRFRPAPGGVSIAHADVTAGTLGCLVHRDGEPLILSNNHVLANSNDAVTGDAVLQPGPIDGGRLETDRIATLDRFVPIIMAEEASGCAFANGVAAVANWFARLAGSGTRLQAVSRAGGANLVDAATARPVSDGLVLDTIVDVGAITGQRRASLGMRVHKSGRTTGHTHGEIEQVDVTVDVGYGAGKTARFTDQLMAGAMSQGGDSGSAVLDESNAIVGLLFAGSDRTTLFNRIEHVFSALEIGL